MKHYGFALALIGACTGESVALDTGSDPATDTDDSTVPPSPTVTAAFTPATVVAGESSQLDVSIEDFVVVDPTASPPPVAAPGEGHYHVYLGDALVQAAWTPSISIGTGPDDAPGDYVFRIALVDSEHNELAPAVETEAVLTIE